MAGENFKYGSRSTELAQSSSSSKRRFFIVYPKGLGESAIHELEFVLRADIVKHFKEHNAILFEYSGQLKPLCCVSFVQAVDYFHSQKVDVQVEYSDRVRHKFGRKKVVVQSEESLDQARQVLKSFFEAHGKEYITFSGEYDQSNQNDNPIEKQSNAVMLSRMVTDKSWKVSLQKKGDFGFSSDQIIQVFGDIFSAARVAENIVDSIPLAPVSLKRPAVELVISVISSKEEENIADLWLFGFRHNNHSGENNEPKIFETVANCSKYLPFTGPPTPFRNGKSKHTDELSDSHTQSSTAAGISLRLIWKFIDFETRGKNIVFLDPMCGIGTIPFVFRQVWRRYFEDNNYYSSNSSKTKQNVKLIGFDVSEAAIIAANRSVQTDDQSICSDLTFETGDTSDLSLENNSVDLIFVDPPWGQRHGSHSSVNKNWHKWKKEWIRVLKPNGLLALITTRSNHVLNEYNDVFSKDVRLVEQFLFDNAGFDNCTFFLFRKLGDFDRPNDVVKNNSNDEGKYQCNVAVTVDEEQDPFDCF
eukprot:gene826-872_t